MPLHRTKASAAGLGRAIVNRRAKEASQPQKESQLYVLDESNPLQSVTHERDLDEFLANAALADTDFATERTKAKIISVNGGDGSNPFLLSKEQENEIARKQVDLRHGLRIPRRPPWTKQTTRQELERQERDAFLDWRRDLAQLAESSNLLLTPFERNIQLWRQLWRVLERSHLIVQIVDARNPLGFRCVDLESYAEELGAGKKCLLLINKSDLLTEEQRNAWADYFERKNIAYAFFSAVAAAESREKRLAEEDRELEEAETDDEELEEDEAESSGSLEAGATPIEEQSEEEEEVEEEGDVDDEDEAGWATEEEEAGDSREKRAASPDPGNTVPLSEAGPSSSQRTRVLSVTELEDLFESAAPPVSEEKLVIGLVGYPNVGKSSTINALLGEKKTSVSATPGKTKHFQTLLLTDRITLCDCPGLVFPQFANTQADMIVDGVLPIDQMREYSAPVELLCRRIPRDILESTYGIRIDVRDVEEGGTGQVGWEEFLSAYAIARGMTRSSFGMPDTSRAARYVLKDYVNARLLYAHPPPRLIPDDYMSSSWTRTRSSLKDRKKAPVTHVVKGADTFVPAAGNASTSSGMQPTSRSIKSNAASAPGRTGKEKADAIDGVFFGEQNISVMRKGRGQMDPATARLYAQQRMLGPDGQPLPLNQQGLRPTGKAGKRHFKGREGKKRSGKGYD